MRAVTFSSVSAWRNKFSMSLWSFNFFNILLKSFALSLYPFAFFLPPHPLALLVPLSHWDESHVLWRPSETKPHIEAVAGGRKRRRRLQKKLCQCSWPRHQPETKLDVVKLSNYLRKLQQNLKRQKNREGEKFFGVLRNKQSELYMFFKNRSKLRIKSRHRRDRGISRRFIAPRCWLVAQKSCGGASACCWVCRKHIFPLSRRVLFHDFAFKPFNE